jgi:tRNA G18 (ribose-2'-O)-methylase SpoU
MRNTQLQHANHLDPGKRYPLCFLAHDMALAANVGSLFRVADALGVERIHLTGRSVVPPSARIRRTSRATEKFVPHAYAEDPLVVVAALRGEGYRLVSLESSTASIDLRELALAAGDKVCLVLGAEDAGVCQALLDASDVTVHIPMRGGNSSMNVATACAIASYDIITRFMA